MIAFDLHPDDEAVIRGIADRLYHGDLDKAVRVVLLAGLDALRRERPLFLAGDGTDGQSRKESRNIEDNKEN